MEFTMQTAIRSLDRRSSAHQASEKSETMNKHFATCVRGYFMNRRNRAARWGLAVGIVAMVALTGASAASAQCVGDLSVTSGQTLNGNPVDLTTITSLGTSSNQTFTVNDGACGPTSTQTDNFNALPNGTRPIFGNWTGVNGSDGTLGWVAFNAATASANTGPTAATATSTFVYLESSGTGQTYGVGVTAGSSQYIESNVLAANLNSYSLTFDWHMRVNGNTNASLHVDAWNGTTWVLDITGGAIWTGTNGDVWTTTSPISLRAFTNPTLKVRLRYSVGTTGQVYDNDVAFDNLVITSTPYIFNGNLTQAATASTTSWTGGTKCLTVSYSTGTCTTTASGTFTFVDAQTTVGNGTDPGSLSVCPSTAIVDLDSFTLQASSGTDTVTAVQVNFAAGTAGGVGVLSITNDGGGVTYGFVNNPTDPQNVTVSNIPVTTSVVQYKVRIAPAAHLLMPAVPGATYAVSGTVNQITSTNAKVYNDSTSAWITIDNASPTDGTWGTVTPGNGQVVLNWTNSGSGDFASAVILRSTATIADAPLEGVTYGAGNTIGASTVIFAGNATTFTDTTVINGNGYYYKVFAKDACGNYALGVQTGPHTPTGPNTTVSDGTPNASNSSVCPQTASVFANAFGLQVSANPADTITSVSVNIGAVASAGVDTVTITTDTDTVLGSVSTHVGGVWTVTGLSLAAGTTLSQYRVHLTPKSHAALPPSPGSTYSAQAPVSAVAHALANAIIYSDVADATITIDNTSPADSSWGAIVPANNQITLNWTNPGGDFASAVILRDTAPIAVGLTEGATYFSGNTIGSATVVYAGSGTSTVNATTNQTVYYYKIFAKDACGNYATGVQTGPHTYDTRVATQLPTANIDSCTQITVSAPFLGDVNTNSTTTFSVGSSVGGPFTVVCNLVAGASPRTCVDAVVGATAYYYQVDFADGDGVVNADPQVIGPLTTPLCSQNDTVASSISATATGCKTLNAQALFVGDDDGDGTTLFQYNTSNTWPGTTACAAVGGGSPRNCNITGLLANTTYWVRAIWTDPDGVAGSPLVFGTATTPACVGDGSGPMLSVVSPNRDATIGATERIKVQVSDDDGVNATNISWSVDGGVPTALTAANRNANYDCSFNPGINAKPNFTCGVYEFDLDTIAQSLSNGNHYVTIFATDNAGGGSMSTQLGLSIVVRNSGTRAAGAGNLLRRSTGGQLCMDCHALPSHNSQVTSTKYGSWAMNCMDCHQPHETANVSLFREVVSTPNSGLKNVDFRRSVDTSLAVAGSAAQGYANTASPGNGPCEVCHTKTTQFNNDGSGAGTHFTYACTGCHTHETGFTGSESAGGFDCADCHDHIFERMNGNVATNMAGQPILSRHTMGGVRGVNDSWNEAAGTDPQWANLNVAESARSCTNMCHSDHVHGPTHDLNVYTDAKTRTTEAQNDQAVCLSCHSANPVTIATKVHPAVPSANYLASAHDYVGGTYGLHDGSTFERDCTKCHGDGPEAFPTSTAAEIPFAAVHFSQYDSLLRENPNNAGNDAAFVCYECHGTTQPAAPNAGGNVQSELTQAYRHTMSTDTVHDTIAEATPTYNVTYGAGSGGNRHVGCLDCHNPHESGATLHTAGTNVIAATGSPLSGVSGLTFSEPATNWGTTAAGNFTPTARASKEYEICFKCHSSFGFGTSPPTYNSAVWTDVAQEFNPNNKSGHPIVNTLNNYPNSTAPKLLAANQLLAPWVTNRGNQTMYCSDCHGDEANAPVVAGPHGSAIKFILRGQYTQWPGSGTIDASWSTSFCRNCHPIQSGGTYVNDAHKEHDNRSAVKGCYNCHILVPHGGAMSRLIGDGNATNFPVRYAYQGVKTNMFVTSFTKTTPTNYSKSNCSSATNGCTTHSGTASENWP